MFKIRRQREHKRVGTMTVGCAYDDKIKRVMRWPEDWWWSEKGG